MVSASSTSLAPLVAHIALTIAGVALLVLTPPASGSIVLVGIGDWSAGSIATAAIGRGARIAGRGPGDHSLIVIGDRDRLLPLIRHGIVPLAAPAILCAA